MGHNFLNGDEIKMISGLDINFVSRFRGIFILKFSYRRCNIYVMHVLYLFDSLERSTATTLPTGSCQDKCIADLTAKGIPDCIKKDACQRACNDGTCPEYNS